MIIEVTYCSDLTDPVGRTELSGDNIPTQPTWPKADSCNSFPFQQDVVRLVVCNNIRVLFQFHRTTPASCENYIISFQDPE